MGRQWYQRKYMGNSTKIQRERGAKAMKHTLVNLIIGTAIIINMVKAGPMKAKVEVQVQLSPISNPIQEDDCIDFGRSCNMRPDACCKPYRCLRFDGYYTCVN